MLEVLGLSPAEERTYDALVTARAVTVSELATQFGSSRASLSRLPGRTARFAAVDPSVAIAALTQSQEQALESARDRMRELSAMFTSRHDGTHPAEQVEIIDGTDNVWNVSVRLQHSAREQIRCFDAPPYLDRHPDRDNSDEHSVLRKGLTVRCVYAREGLLLPGRFAHIQAAIAGGEQARTVASLPMKVLIADERLALIPVLPVATGGPSAAYLIHPSSLLDAIAALFESYWERAAAVQLGLSGTAAEPSDSGLTDADRRILTMLVAGATDDAIGRATGCSMRTVQRHIRNLMALAGAQTRFQLGVAAREQRWV
jgi:DNA-binding CsgD family transcriptional regulator